MKFGNGLSEGVTSSRHHHCDLPGCGLCWVLGAHRGGVGGGVLVVLSCRLGSCSCSGWSSPPLTWGTQASLGSPRGFGLGTLLPFLDLQVPAWWDKPSPMPAPQRWLPDPIPSGGRRPRSPGSPAEAPQQGGPVYWERSSPSECAQFRLSSWKRKAL